MSVSYFQSNLSMAHHLKNSNSTPPSNSPPQETGDKLILPSNLIVNMEDVPNMSLGKPVTFLTKCGPTRLRPKVLTRLPGVPKATPDATRVLLMGIRMNTEAQLPR